MQPLGRTPSKWVHFGAASVSDFLAVNVRQAPNSEQTVDFGRRLDAAVTFLRRSIQQGNQCASSKAYQVGKGWLPPYRETTGYIIPTFLELAERDRPDLALMAEQMGEWLADVQEPNGGFIERDLRQDVKPIVFNTGQILHGFNALILRRKREDLIDNARSAADFIVSSADTSGSFVRNEHFGIPHAYNVRSAWALLTLGRILEERGYEEAALANADWTVAQQTAAGFFRNNVFQPGRPANTHGIAYVLQGLIEIHGITKQPVYLDSVRLAADRIALLYDANQRVVSEIGEDWEFLSRHLCLTGYAQLAIVFFRLYGLVRNDRYLNVGLKLLDDVAATQDISAPDAAHFGAIKGSYPIYGRYAPLQYPNWATKFFIDAILAREAALTHRQSELTGGSTLGDYGLEGITHVAGNYLSETQAV